MAEQHERHYVKARAANWDLGDTVNQVVIFMQLVRDNYPGVQITETESYPIVSASLMNWWVSALTTTSAGWTPPVQPPDQLEIDHEWNVSNWSWNDFYSMRDHVHSLGWSFGYIYTATAAVQGTNDWDWYNGVLTRGYGVTAAAVFPDIYVFESWEPYVPSNTIPETLNTPTFMGTVNSFRYYGYFPG